MSRFLSRAGSSLLPYTPGEQPQGRKWIKLNTNESPYPPAPGVAAAILAGYGKESAGAPPEIASLRLYSDPEERILVEAIAAHFGVKPEQVIVGTDRTKCWLCLPRVLRRRRAFSLGRSDVRLLSGALRPLWIPYETIPLKEDFTLDTKPYENCGKNVIIANPNAPTGLALPLSAIAGVAESNPDRVVMVDEAYVDFGGESAVSLLGEYGNLVVIQTFSKSRSLAGARVGFAIAGEELIADMNRARCSFNPYNVNRLSMLRRRRRSATTPTRRSARGASAARGKRRRPPCESWALRYRFADEFPVCKERRDEREGIF